MRTPHTERYDADIPDGIPLPVPEAAAALGISPEAVRNRLSRGTLKSVKEAGRVFVLIDRNMARHTDRSTDDQPTDTPADEPSRLVEEMRSRIEDLRDQLAEEREARRRADAIIMQLSRANAALVERVPELEAAPQSGQENVREPRQDVVVVEDQEEPGQRTWWRKVFGFYSGGHRS